jgi:hypothetical protein
MSLTRTGLLATAVALTLPLTAFAQSADANYCQALIKKWREIGVASTDATVPEAINQCNQGNTAAGIPVLEKVLKDNKVSLPPRG